MSEKYHSVRDLFIYLFKETHVSDLFAWSQIPAYKPLPIYGLARHHLKITPSPEY